MSSLIDARRITEALAFVDFVARYGDDRVKVATANILTYGAFEQFAEPEDLEGAVAALRQALELVGALDAGVTATANYFLGVVIFEQIRKLDPLAENQKSCEIAVQMGEMLIESESALNRGRPTNLQQEDVYKGRIREQRSRISSMVALYCR
jgi:hypothetical protein